MNTLKNKYLVSVGFVLSLGLLSCQENNLVTPDKPVTALSESVNDIISPNLPTVYKLTRDGKATLTYYPDGRLKTATNGPDFRGNSNVSLEYTYNTGSIQVIAHAGTSLLYDRTYLLDATGRCYEYNEVSYTTLNLPETLGVVYTYNGKGQLQSAADKSNLVIRTEYSYTADGDMKRAISYGINYSTHVAEIKSDYTFAYDQPTGDPVLADRNGLNLEEAGFPDPFLKIFGPSNKHLVKLIQKKSSLGGKYYTYTLNVDGYPTKREEYNIGSGVLVERKTYGYQVSNLSVQF